MDTQRSRREAYPAAVLSGASESTGGAKEEESGSVAMDRHLKLEPGFSRPTLELGNGELLQGHRGFAGKDAARTRPEQIMGEPETVGLSLSSGTKRTEVGRHVD